MSILSQNSEKANENLGTVEHFLSRFHVGKLLRKCNANGYTGAVKPPVRRTGNRKSGH